MSMVSNPFVWCDNIKRIDLHYPPIVYLVGDCLRQIAPGKAISCMVCKGMKYCSIKCRNNDIKRHENYCCNHYFNDRLSNLNGCKYECSATFEQKRIANLKSFEHELKWLFVESALTCILHEFYAEKWIRPSILAAEGRKKKHR